MPVYHILSDQTVIQLKPSSFDKERELQSIFEKNLESILGVRCIASEFTTGDRQRGRIDTIGLDQNSYPTIIEYKKTSKENIINQGLFYLDWLIDHKGDFTLKARGVLGKDIQIDWGSPRLILIAESFSEYDKYAVNRIGSSIELWIYRLYDQEYLYLEQIFSTSPVKALEKPNKRRGQVKVSYTLEDHLKGKPSAILELFQDFRERIFSLSDEKDIEEKAVKKYIGYKHGKNFCEVWIQASKLKIWLDITSDNLNDPYNLSRDVSNIGHWGTGDVEINLDNHHDLNKVLYLIEQAYLQTL